MKINEKRLLKTLENIKITKLSEYLGTHRINIYYHINNLRSGKNTLKIETIKKISKFISGKDDIFFED